MPASGNPLPGLKRGDCVTQGNITEKMPTVNYHLWKSCNMSCGFCFATFNRDDNQRIADDVRKTVVSSANHRENLRYSILSLDAPTAASSTPRNHPCGTTRPPAAFRSAAKSCGRQFQNRPTYRLMFRTHRPGNAPPYHTNTAAPATRDVDTR